MKWVKKLLKNKEILWVDAMHLFLLIYRDIREPALNFLPGKKSRQEFHRVIFVLKAKGKGTTPWRQHETMGVDLTGQDSVEWQFKFPDLSSHPTTAANLHMTDLCWTLSFWLGILTSPELFSRQCLENKLVILSK